MQPLWHDPAYMRLEFAIGEGGPILELATRLISEGDINVLVGTAALLGEGWDAPAVNSLVMATVIGSYVSSNQIRGRAIRVDPQDHFKTATIWHLACVQPGEVLQEPGLEVDRTGFRAGDRRLDLVGTAIPGIRRAATRRSSHREWNRSIGNQYASPGYSDCVIERADVP